MSKPAVIGSPTPAVSDELTETGAVRLDRFSPALITWAAHRLAANNAAVYKARFGVSLMEWRVLLHLFGEPGATATYLAQTIGYNKATISRTVDSLHRRGLVTETLNPTDARSSHLFITDAGSDLYRRILPVALDQERVLLANLSADEAEMFVDLMARVVDALRSAGARKPRKKAAPQAALKRLERRAKAARAPG